MSVTDQGPDPVGLSAPLHGLVPMEDSPNKGAKPKPSKAEGPAGRSFMSKLSPYLFVAAAVILLLGLTYLPAVNLFRYSVSDWSGLGPIENFVGIDNFVQVFTDPSIFFVFGVSLYYFVASFVQMAIALYFAALLSYSTRFSGFFRGVLFFPHMINGVAIGFVFLYLFQPGGTLDSVLAVVGITNPPQWLGDASIANFSLAGTSVWRYTGMNFVLFLGAIQSIPNTLYEAADIDGANRFQQFRFIMFPGIRRIIGLSFILAIAGCLSAFEIPLIMTNGANGTATFALLTLQTAFTYHQVGLAAAMAIILLIIVLLATWIQRMIFPDEKVDLT